MAEDEDTTEEAPFGVLLEPLLGLISGLGEGVVWLIQSQLLGMQISTVYIDVDPTDGLWSFLGFAGAATIGALAVFFSGGTALIGAGVALAAGVVTKGAIEEFFEDDFYLPMYAISPQEIFSDQIPALHINFINPKDYDEETQDNDGVLPVYNSAKVLGPQVSKWYVAIRNIVLIGLMAVLLYIGIRIIISSTAGEKAKYKEHIKDWLVAIILVIFMHYIMAFALTITEYLTNMLNSKNQLIAFEFSENTVHRIEEEAEVEIPKSDDGKYYYYTNLMGYARLMQQMDSRDDTGNQQFTWSFIGYTIIFMVLVIYTVMFLIIYLKRVIYMAFLTMIAPLVALTYPIDKISDGQAQAFNMWLKEYVYNLLLQPFHLLLYIILIGSVMDLAINNMLYAIVALGFLIPAEQLLRKFFGFEKASTTGSIVGGVVGGSMAMNAISNLGKIGSGPKRGNSEKNISSGDGNSKTRLTDRTPESNAKSTDELIDEAYGSDSNSNNNEDGQINLKSAPTKEDDDNTKDLPSGYTTTGSGIIVPNREPLQIQRPEKPPESSDVENEDKEHDEQPQETIRMSQGNRNSEQQPNLFNRARTGMKKTLNNHPVAATGLKYTGKALTGIGKRAPRAITKLALGAAIGTAGVAAGVASGDWSNIAAYGAAAAGVGASMGEGISNLAGNAGRGIKNVSGDIRSDYMRRRYSPEERRKIENERADKEWEKSESTINLYMDKFGVDGYEEAMKRAKEYRKQGITDDNAIIAAQKLKGLKDDGSETPSAERLLYAKASSAIKSEKDLKAFGERMKEKNVEDKKINEFYRNIRKMNKM